MADDLDAFFDEVSAAEAEAVAEEPVAATRTTTEATADLVPDAKRQKTHHDDDDDKGNPPGNGTSTSSSTKHKPHRPMGVVVAAASSVSKSAVPRPPPVIPTASPNMTATFTAPSPAAAATTTTAAPQQPPLPPGPPPPTKNTKSIQRAAAGKSWVDPSLADWPENDYRLFVGNLSKDISDDQLLQHFNGKYPSVAMARVVRNQKTGDSKGFGFVSFLQPLECARAMREMDQSWLSSRPIRVKRSDWKDRNLNVQRKKEKKKRKQQLL